jgi:hypothetical protein
MRLRTSLLAAGACAALLGTAAIASAQVSIGISVHLAPPALPVYEQPDMPAPGYLWVPGYWAWGDDGGYYWVPGTWVQPPQSGLLWTPGYWGWSDGAYVWHEGYWGPEVGFYGGVDYGFGYGPHGYDGGYWNHGQLYYNSAVNRIPPGLRVAHVYRHAIPGGGAPGRASFNGGHGGVQVRPTVAQLSAEHERHVMPIGAQRQLADSAHHDQALRADYNHGHPGIAVTPRPEAFARPGGEAARGPTTRSDEQGSRFGRAPEGSNVNTGSEAAPARRSPAAAQRNVPQPAERPTFAAHEHVPAGPREAAHAVSHASGAHGGAAHPAQPAEQRDQRPPRG